MRFRGLDYYGPKLDGHNHRIDKHHEFNERGRYGDIKLPCSGPNHVRPAGHDGHGGP